MKVTLSERDRNGKVLWSTSFDATVRADYRGKKASLGPQCKYGIYQNLARRDG
jgi:hypothetical protein